MVDQHTTAGIVVSKIHRAGCFKIELVTRPFVGQRKGSRLTECVACENESSRHTINSFCPEAHRILRASSGRDFTIVTVRRTCSLCLHMQSILAGIMIGNSVHNRVPIVPRIIRTLTLERSTLEVAVPLHKIFCSRAAVNQQYVVDPDVAVAGSDKAQKGVFVSSITGGIGIEAILILCPFGSQRSPRVQRHGGAERAAGGVEVGNLCIDCFVSRRCLCAERQFIEVTGAQLDAVCIGNLCCSGNLHGSFDGFDVDEGSAVGSCPSAVLKALILNLIAAGHRIHPRHRGIGSCLRICDHEVVDQHTTAGIVVGEIHRAGSFKIELVTRPFVGQLKGSLTECVACENESSRRIINSFCPETDCKLPVGSGSDLIIVTVRLTCALCLHMQSILAGIMIGNSVHSRPPIVPRIKRTLARGRGTLEVAVPLYKIFCSRTAVNQRNIVNPGISRTGSDKA